MIDEYTRLVQEAQRETDALLASDPARSPNDPTLPIYRLAALDRIERERQRFDAGDRVALLGAIRICANHRLVMPDWVARGFIRCYDLVLNCMVGSWDEAFGRPFPKGVHLSARRKKREKGTRVWLEVRRMQEEEDRGIDDELFAEVGKKLGLGKTLVSEYYYAQKAYWDAALSPTAAALLEPYKVPEKSGKLRKVSRRTKN